MCNCRLFKSPHILVLGDLAYLNGREKCPVTQVGAITLITIITIITTITIKKTIIQAREFSRK